MRMLGFITILLALGAGCSRANVESMNHMNQGVVLATQKQYVEAVEQLERAAAIDSSNDQAFFNLAIVHMEMRKFERAKDDLTRAIAVAPENAAYQEKLGTVLIELKDWSGAKKALEKTVVGRADAVQGLLQACSGIRGARRPAVGAAALHRSNREGTRSFLPAYNALGSLYADLGYLDHAVQVSQSALKVAQGGSEEAAKIHNLLGTIYQQQQKFDLATQEFRAALEIVPGMRDAIFSLGWTYALQGNKEEAKRYLKKFLAVAGDAPEHYQKAARDKLSEMSEGF